MSFVLAVTDPRTVQLAVQELAECGINVIEMTPPPDSEGLRVFRVPGRTTVPAAEAHLNPLEVDVLRGIADGLSYDRIGVGLGMSGDSVKYRARVLIHKLRAAGPANAVLIAYRLGILGDSK